MKMDVTETRANEIIKLHEEIIGLMKRSLVSAIRIGELLTEQKGLLNHGEFGKWITANLPFTSRTAQNYMRVYKERDRLKSETVSHLTEAYQLLAEPEAGEPVKHPWVTKCQQCEKFQEATRKLLPERDYNSVSDVALRLVEDAVYLACVEGHNLLSDPEKATVERCNRLCEEAKLKSDEARLFLKENKDNAFLERTNFKEVMLTSLGSALISFHAALGAGG